MTFTQAIRSGFAKYVTFSGRASRSEFWYWNLFVFLASIAAQIIDYALLGNDTVSSPLTSLFDLATFLPALAVAVRRLHDGDRSGWWFLLILVPLIGFIVLLVWFCQKGSDGYNRFGADPFKPGGYATQPGAA